VIPGQLFSRSFVFEKGIGLPGNFLLKKTVAAMRKNLLAFAIAVAIVCAPLYLSGAAQISSLAGVLIEKGYTPVKLKRASNHFYVSCKLNGRSASLLVDTGAGATLIEPAMLKSLGVPLTKVEGDWYGFLGPAAKSMNAGEIKDFQVGPYQAGAHRVGAWDFSSYSRAKGAPRMDVILGIDFLHRNQAVIDCFQMDLFLKPPSVSSASATLSAGLRARAAARKFPFRLPTVDQRFPPK